MRQGARSLACRLVGAVACCLLAGCTGASGPPPSATTHPGTAPTSSTPSPSATQDSGQAAIAAVQRMFDAYNAMLKSGSSKAYRATFTAGCGICLKDAQTVDDIYAKGNRIDGGVYQLANLKVTGHFSPRLVTVQGEVSGKPATIRHGNRVVDHFPGFSRTPVGWSVSMTRAVWLVSRGTVLK